MTTECSSGKLAAAESEQVVRKHTIDARLFFKEPATRAFLESLGVDYNLLTKGVTIRIYADERVTVSHEYYPHWEEDAETRRKWEEAKVRPDATAGPELEIDPRSAGWNG
jgi:hypothetical protein